MNTRLAVLALFLTMVWGGAFALISHSVGDHSGPGFLCAALGLPGVIVAAFMGSRPGAPDLPAMFLVIAALVNWAFYFGLLSGIVFVARKFIRARGTQS